MNNSVKTYISLALDADTVGGGNIRQKRGTSMDEENKIFLPNSDIFMVKKMVLFYIQTPSVCLDAGKVGKYPPSVG